MVLIPFYKYYLLGLSNSNATVFSVIGTKVLFVNFEVKTKISATNSSGCCVSLLWGYIYIYMD